MFNVDRIDIKRITKDGEITLFTNLSCDIQEDRSRNNINAPNNQSLLRKVIFVDKSKINIPLKDKDLIINLNNNEKYRLVGSPYGGNILSKRIQMLAESK